MYGSVPGRWHKAPGFDVGSDYGADLTTSWGAMSPERVRLSQKIEESPTTQREARSACGVWSVHTCAAAIDRASRHTVHTCTNNTACRQHRPFAHKSLCPPSPPSIHLCTRPIHPCMQVVAVSACCSASGMSGQAMTPIKVVLRTASNRTIAIGYDSSGRLTAYPPSGDPCYSFVPQPFEPVPPGFLLGGLATESVIGGGGPGFDRLAYVFVQGRCAGSRQLDRGQLAGSRGGHTASRQLRGDSAHTHVRGT